MGIFDDFLQARRALQRRPGFVALAVVTLALGLGANTGLFSVLNAVVLQPLPYREPDRLYLIRTASRSAAGLSGVSFPDFEDAQSVPSAFERTALACYWTFNLTGKGVPERLVGARVGGEFFEAMGVRALFGRTLGRDDDRAGTPEVVVLGHGLWTRVFGADPDAVGRSMLINGIGATIVGVMPASFRFPGEDVELWSALSNNMTGMPRDARWPTGVLRLRAGVTRAAAQQALDALSQRLSAQHPQTNAVSSLRLQPLHEAVVGGVRPTLLLLSGAVALVLLLACVNVGHLLLAQALARRREDAVRLALGASPWRLLRLQLAENLWIALLGAAAGVGLAFGAVAALRAWPPAGLPRLDDVHVDGLVLAFAAAMAVVVAVVLAVLRMLDGLRADPAQALAAGKAGSLGAKGSRLRSALVAAEVATAAVLLVGGGLLLRSFHGLLSVDPGYDAARVATGTVFLGPPQYRGIAQQKAYIQKALERLGAMPGVQNVGAITALPLEGQDSRMRLAILGRTFEPDRAPSALYRSVSPGYFESVRIPLLRGRSLEEKDGEDTPQVALVNAAAASRLFPGQDALGQRLRFENVGPAAADAWMTVVGVVGDVRSRSLSQEEEPAVYGSYRQRRAVWMRWTSFAVRTSQPAQDGLRGLREALLGVDPDQPVFGLISLEDLRSRSLERQRLQTALVDLFAALALALAGIGSYGVLSQAVRQRTAEIGVRMALGASLRDVVALVFKGALVPAVLGLLVGLPCAALLARSIESQLFGVRSYDPLTYAAVATLLLASAALAALVPARRAARVDPAVALREG